MRRAVAIVTVVIAVGLVGMGSASAQSVPAIPPPPPINYPVPPAEAAPAFQLLAPTVGVPCGTIGLGVVVLAIAGAASPVNPGSLLAYMTPVFIACSYFPPLSARSACDVDAQIADQATGAGAPVGPPAVFGNLVDQFLVAEAILAAQGGQQLPASPAQQIADALGCVPS